LISTRALDQGLQNRKLVGFQNRQKSVGKPICYSK
jgi:hypothetical protein